MINASFPQTRPNNKNTASKGAAAFSRTYVPQKKVAHFTRDLAVMLNAKMLLTESIAILSRQTGHEGLRQMLDHISAQLKNGRSFADAICAYPKLFDRFYVSLVEAGEVTGRLGEMLSRLADYMQKMAALKQRFMQAMAYPFLVITVALFALGFIMLYVVPTFSDIFRDFDAPLPWPTLVMINISNFLQDYLLHSVLLGALLVIGVKYLIKKPAVKLRVDRFFLAIPLIGAMIRRHYIAHFCRTLGTLLESRIPLLKALEISAKSTRSPYIRIDIERMRQYVAKGAALTDSLRFSTIFPLMVVQMIAVGEKTAELPEMLIKIADFYDQEIDQLIGTLATIVEPVIIVFLGLAIGAILVSIYLPLFNMSSIMTG